MFSGTSFGAPYPVDCSTDSGQSLLIMCCHLIAPSNARNGPSTTTLSLPTHPVERTPSLHSAPNHHKMMLSARTIAPPDSALDHFCNDGEILMPEDTTKKHKRWNCTYYIKKKNSSMGVWVAPPP